MDRLTSQIRSCMSYWFIHDFTATFDDWILFHFFQYLIWGTIATVPVVTFGMFLWTIIESFQSNFIEGSGPTGHDTRYGPTHLISLTMSTYYWLCHTLTVHVSLTVMSFFPLITGILYLRILLGNREKVEHTLTVFEVSLIYGVCFHNVTMLFTVVWIAGMWCIACQSRGCFALCLINGRICGIFELMDCLV